MLPTFSVNPDIYAKMGKIVKLNLNTDKPREQYWLADAILRIVDGKPNVGENLNLSAYSLVCEKNSQLNRQTEMVSLLTNEEVHKGYQGVSDLVAECDDSSLAKVIDNVDAKQFVNSFLDMREYIFLEEGTDIWRLLNLCVCTGDIIARKKLNEVVERYYSLQDLVEYVISNPRCYRELEGRLC